jgi:hypothetical protein
MMEAVRTSETSVDNHFTRQYNPEDSSEQKASLYVSTASTEILKTVWFLSKFVLRLENYVKFLPRCLCMRDDWKNTIYE